MNEPTRPPVTDSFLFWIYLFCTAALVVLALMEPRYQRRQVQIERKYQARLRATELAADGAYRTNVSTEDDLRITLRPLIYVLSGVLVVAWSRFWYVWLRRAPRSTASIGRGTRS